MWKEILRKLETLKELDKQYQVFGAENHQYKLKPALTTTQLQKVENELGTTLPHALSEFYLTIGNGGAGPNYGLISSEHLRGYHPHETYPGTEAYRKIAAEEETLSEDGYFEIDHDRLTGLIIVIHEGCGHEICLATQGEHLGKIVNVSCDGFVTDSEHTLLDFYQTWLDREIEAFTFVKTLVDTELSAKEISEKVVNKLQRYDGRDILSSLINSKKPKALFGAGNQAIYHGAEQFPWYERALEKYRNKGKHWWMFWT